MIKIFRTLLVIIGMAGFAVVANADDVYDVANIKVNATGKDGIQAKEKALAQAEAKGVIILFERLLSAAQKDRALKRLDKDTRSLLVKGFSVKNEQSGATQYIAEITIKFRRTAVQRFLNNIGAQYSDVQSSMSLLVPILTNANGSSVIWSAQNPWSEALSSHDLRNSLIPLKIANSSEAGLLATETEIINKNENAIFQLASVAGENAGSVFAHMTLTEQTATLNTTGLISFSKQYSTGDGLNVVYAQAANDFLKALEKGWRNNNISSKPQFKEIKALVIFQNLDHWIALRGLLGQVGSIGSFDTDAMTAEGAFISVKHKGTIAELSGELQVQGLTLYNLGEYYEIRG